MLPSLTLMEQPTHIKVLAEFWIGSALHQINVCYKIVLLNTLYNGKDVPWKMPIMARKCKKSTLNAKFSKKCTTSI